MNNSLFRKKLFGGLNSSDVEEYIQNLEHEIESVKVLHQKEKNDLLKKMEEYEEALPDQEDSALQEQMDELMKKISEIEQENSRLKEERESLEKEKILNQGEEGDAQWSERIQALMQENDTLKKKIEDQAEEIKEQEEKLLNQREESETRRNDDSLFDYSTVSKIIEDANKNAEVIKEEARLEAAEILKEADREAEERRAMVASRMSSQLEEKGIQLMAAKYKIEQYVKDLNSLQQGLYNLYHRMNKLIETMPVRLDDYWEGEHYEMLENRRLLAQNKENKETEPEKKPNLHNEEPLD